MNHDLRKITYKIISEFEKNKSQLKLTRDQIINKAELSSKDKSRITVFTNEVVKWRKKIDYYISINLKKSISKLDKRILNVLRIGYYEILFDAKIPIYASVDYWVQFTKIRFGRLKAGFCNAILRKARKVKINSNKNFKNLSIFFSYPEWLVQKWENQFGMEQTIKLLKYFNLPPSYFLRIPKNKKISSSLIIYKNLKIQNKESNFFRIESGLSDILENDFFKKNNCSIQDRASGAVVEILNPKPGSTVLDVCAAPGTKANYISDFLNGEGEIHASDIDPIRMKLGVSRSESLSLNINWSNKNATKDLFLKSDYVIVDAPCSGTGVLGKKLDIRWRRKKSDIKSFASLQLNILKNISKFVKNDGILVYATCSLENEENWDVVSQFLKFDNSFTIDSPIGLIPNEWINDKNCMQTIPYKHKVDGIFAARLVKNET